jgi:two-component system chemotaxis response regulator CheY
MEVTVMKVLLVDDSQTMRSIQRGVLESLGVPIEFSEAGDGMEALRVIATTPGRFDLMLVDWNMPRMDGITFVGLVRHKDKQTPIIMMTTESERAQVVKAIQAGVTNYVIKPFEPELLLSKVRPILSPPSPPPAAPPAKP